MTSATATAHSFTVGGPFVFPVLCPGVPLSQGADVSPSGDWVSEDDLECPNSKGIEPLMNCLKFPPTNGIFGKLINTSDFVVY